MIGVKVGRRTTRVQIDRVEIDDGMRERAKRAALKERHKSIKVDPDTWVDDILRAALNDAKGPPHD